MNSPSPPVRRIVVATHHKAGTVYCLRVFGEICHELGLGFWDMESSRKPDPWHIAFHGNATLQRLQGALSEGCRLLHVVRHPKSLIVSGARYHLDAEEAWLDQPRRRFGGRSYRRALSEIDSEEGRLRFEMVNKAWDTIVEMVELESASLGVDRMTVKLEDLSHDSSRRTYDEILSFMSFEGEIRTRGMARFVKHALWSMEKMPAHSRGGVGDAWRELFGDALDARFEALFGQPEIALGYRRQPFPTIAAGSSLGSGFCPDRPVVWFSVPKTASTSIERALRGRALLAGRQWEVGKVFRLHRGEFESVRRRFPDRWGRATKFTVVRNPWDRLVSGWRYVAADRPLRELLLNLPERTDRHRWHHVTRTQSEFLVDESGRLIPDHILRFESLQEDMNRFCESVGLTPIPLPHVNRTSRQEYRAYYDDETRGMVADLFRRDIELFGYEY